MCHSSVTPLNLRNYYAYPYYVTDTIQFYKSTGDIYIFMFCSSTAAENIYMSRSSRDIVWYLSLLRAPRSPEAPGAQLLYARLLTNLVGTPLRVSIMNE